MQPTEQQTQLHRVVLIMSNKTKYPNHHPVVYANSTYAHESSMCRVPAILFLLFLLLNFLQLQIMCIQSTIPTSEFHREVADKE